MCGKKKKDAYGNAKQNYKKQGLTDTDASAAAQAKAEGVPLYSSDKDFVTNNAFANRSAQSITNLGADSRGADLFKIVLS